MSQAEAAIYTWTDGQIKGRAAWVTELNVCLRSNSRIKLVTFELQNLQPAGRLVTHEMLSPSKDTHLSADSSRIKCWKAHLRHTWFLISCISPLAISCLDDDNKHRTGQDRKG